MPRGRQVSDDGRHRQISLNISDDDMALLNRMALELGRNRSQTVAWLVRFVNGHRDLYLEEAAASRQSPEKAESAREVARARARAARETIRMRAERRAKSLDGFVCDRPESWEEAPEGAAYNAAFKCWIVPRTRKAAGDLLKTMGMSVYRGLEEYQGGKPLTRGEVDGFLKRWRLEK